jgi:predicted alpha/beta superfamily hydrolase
VTAKQLHSFLPFAGENRYTTASPNVRLLHPEFYMRPLRRKRRVWIYLPPDYDHSDRSYPVMYLQDGQNLFDAATSYAGEWGIDKILNQMIAAGAPPCIMVAIDNGAAKRIQEYAPWDHPRFGKGIGHKYCRFLVETLKPFVDTHFRTLAGPEHTLIGGSSMGGLIAFYGALAFPQVFGQSMIFSPSFWYSSQITPYIKSQAHWAKDSKFLLLSGGDESPAQIINPMHRVADLLRKQGFNDDKLRVEVLPHAGHNEYSWGRAFAHTYHWFWGA